MGRLSCLLFTVTLGAASLATWAQPGPGMGPASGPGYRMGPGPGPAASAPGMGPRAGGRPMGRWGIDHTPGWALMTPEERAEHHKRMSEVKTHEECQLLRAQHRQSMAARAKERGTTLRAPRHDACAGFKP